MLKPKLGICLLVLTVLLIPIVPWIFLGPRLESWTAGLIVGGKATTLARSLVALIGIGLLAGDSFLPIPATIVMSGLGLALGVAAGGIAASLGIFLSGTIAYLVCKRWGTGLAVHIAGEKGLARVEAAMRRRGLFLIAATRSVPVLQEATACLAGLTRMPGKLFFSALAVGCVPTGFAYAAIGASALHNQWWAAGLSLIVPLVTWPLVQWMVRSTARD